MDNSIYLERAKKLKNNSLLFIGYWEHLQKSGKSEGTTLAYTNKIIKFLEYFDRLTVNQISYDGIKTYLNSLKISDNTKNGYCAAIKDFLEFASHTENIQFEISRIDELNIKRKIIKQRKTIPLTIPEIICIRETTNREEYYENLYIFELFFTYGLSLDEIIECTKDAYEPDEKAFILESRHNPIWLSSTLNKLIEEHLDLLIRKKRSWVEFKNKQTGRLINRKGGLILADINQTREIFFPTCPICKERYPNTDEFWVLAEHENDPSLTKWFYCKACVNRMLRNQEK